MKPDLIARGLVWAQSIHATWATVAAQDWNQIMLAAVPLYGAGIMPVCRLVCKIDKPNDFVQGVTRLKAAGIPPYVQIFNEPGDDREWKPRGKDGRGRPNIGAFGGSWAQQAALVFDAGGYPGLQVLGKDEFDAAINSLLGNGRADVLQRAFFVLHNGGANHPPAYPYDPRNQQDHPGATIMDDDTAVLRFLEYKEWMRNAFGFCLPIIGGEAGWDLGNSDDNRYPKLDRPTHAAWTKEVCNWFATGRLSNGEPLPDELFSCNFWIMADYGSAGWWDSAVGPLVDTIDALASIPVFTRSFGGGGPPPPPPPPSHDCPAGQHWDDALQECVDNAPPPASGAVVDPRITWATITQGVKYRVAEVWLYDSKPSDDPESEGNINIYVVVRDAAGNTLQHEAVTQWWPPAPDQATHESTHYTRNGMTAHQQSGDSSFDPKRGEHGPYIMKVGDCAVAGLGLPLRQHTEYLIVVVKQ